MIVVLSILAYSIKSIYFDLSYQKSVLRGLELSDSTLLQVDCSDITTFHISAVADI